MTPHVTPSCLAQYKLPKNREGMATLATQVDLIELSLERDKFDRKKIEKENVITMYIYIYLKK